MAARVHSGLVSATRIKGKAGAGLRRNPQLAQEWLESMVRTSMRTTIGTMMGMSKMRTKG